MRAHPILLTVLVVVIVSGIAEAPAVAAPQTASKLVTTAPASGAIGSTVPISTTLSVTTSGQPIANASVRLEHRQSGAWTAVDTLSTDVAGQAQADVPVTDDAADNVYRTAWDGDATYAAFTSNQVTITPNLTATAPGRGYVSETVPFQARLLRADGAPFPGAKIEVRRRVNGTWSVAKRITTGANGLATTTVRVFAQRSDNAFRAAWAGDGATPPALSALVVVAPARRATTLTLTGPSRITDETTVPLTVRWRANNRRPVNATVTIRRKQGAGWSTYRLLKLGKDGVGTFKVSPRVDTMWKAVGKRGRWFLGDISSTHSLDNIPPGDVVVLPAAAPTPRLHLPPQRRAVGNGPHAAVQRIPNSVWNSMVGRTWHAGCPVGRASLRLLRINYWGYDGYRHRGELVVNARVTGKIARAIGGMYRGGYPIRSMYREDRFGWSPRLRGADDYKSMRAGNTSAFNCRGVVGNPSVRSPHSYGTAIDVNTWENPYRSRQGTVPNSWWMAHSDPLVAWRSRSHPVVRIFARAGLRWTYGLADTQHFDA